MIFRAFYFIVLSTVCHPLDDALDGSAKISPLPALILLSNTFSISSFGLSPDDLNIEEEDQDPMSVNTLMTEWAAALESSVKEVTALPNPMVSSLFIDNSIKFVVLDQSNFQDAVLDCALNHQEYLPFEITQLNSAIDFQSLPEKIYLNPKVLLPNEDIVQIRSKVRDNFNACSIWSKQGLLGIPEILNGDSCNQALLTVYASPALATKLFNIRGRLNWCGPDMIHSPSI